MRNTAVERSAKGGFLARLGFKGALISTVSILMLLSLAITTVVSNKVLKTTTADNLRQAILSSASYEAERIAQHVEKSAKTVSGLSTLYGGYSNKVASEDLMMFAAVVGDVHKVTAGFADGRSYASKHDGNFPGGVGDLSKYDPRTRPWFKQGLESSELTLSDVFFTSRDKQPMLGAMYPVDQGVLLVDIRLNHLHGVLEKMKVVEGAVGIITDSQGMILASTAEFAPIQNKFDLLPAVAPLAEAIFSQDNTFNELKINGKQNVLVSKRIALVTDASWYLIISVDTDIAYAEVNAAAWKLNSLALTIAAISIFVLFIVLGRLYKPVVQLKETIQSLAAGEGDLTRRLAVKSSDDLGQMAVGINAFIQNLQTMMIEVQSMTAKLSDGVEVLKVQEQESSVILHDHASETDQVVTAMEELSCSAQMVAEHAANAVSYTQEADSVANTSQDTIVSAQKSLQALVDVVAQATENVTTMSNETQDIASILGVIGGIAEQTNLLALNAAIEAARAGELGRGFAVVADEVRALAGRTQQSTSEIQTALACLNKGASSVVIAIERTGETSKNAVNEAQAVTDSLGELTGSVTKINDLSAQISSSAQEQNTVIQEINRNMSSIHTMVDGLGSKGQSMRDETANIEAINKQLVGIVSKFKLY